MSLERIQLPAGYCLRQGSSLERALLVKFMQQTYREVEPDGSFAHLAETVDQYFSKETPVWWVDFEQVHVATSTTRPGRATHSVIAGLWLGNAIDQVTGKRHAHIFLLYVVPEHRRKGIGSALMQQAEAWARTRGDRQIGLQVFQSNQAALRLYQGRDYQTRSLWMVKQLSQESDTLPN